MSAMEKAQEIRVIPMTGALTFFLGLSQRGEDGEVKKRILSSARWQYRRVFAAFTALGYTVEKPLMMRRGGVQDPFVTRDQIQEQLVRRHDKNPDSKFWLVAHSLGGVI